MLFFEEVVSFIRVDGLVVFERSDVVIVDNGGFYYVYFVEFIFIVLLVNCGVCLLF